jgi:hypothetical protein
MPKNELDFDKFNKMAEHNDERIILALKLFKKPVPLETLSLLCGLRKDKTCQVLRSLQKYGMVRKAYKRLTSFWEVVK